jgi:hypothetical protein
MRWYHKPPPLKPPVPFYGQRRRRTVFLWLPVTAGLETRWLEWTTITEEYQQFGAKGRDMWPGDDWVFISW